MSRSDFDAFIPAKFVPHIFNCGSGRGCGATALALLTGVPPRRIEAPRDGDWSVGRMRGFLAAHGFRLARITSKNVISEYPSLPVRREHVVLASMRMTKAEATWVVMHNDSIYHNFEISESSAREFLNHPIVDAFMVTHPRWGKYE